MHPACRPVLKHGPRSLTYARVFGWQAHGHNESEIRFSFITKTGPGRWIYPCSEFAIERTCWDPKDGELCLNRARPEETLVEARSGYDVQINRRIWV